MSASRRALQFMEQRWNVASEFQAQRLQNEAIQHWMQDAGTKFMNVTLELDRLLEVVGEIAGEVRQDGEAILRIVTASLIEPCSTCRWAAQHKPVLTLLGLFTTCQVNATVI